jgi:hypothetical protein
MCFDLKIHQLWYFHIFESRILNKLGNVVLEFIIASNIVPLEFLKHFNILIFS